MSQINFFMLPSDEQAFFDMLAERGDTRVIGGRFHKTPRPRLVRSLSRAPAELVLVNPAFGDPLVLHARGEGEYRGRYTFDAYRDPHIDWQRCVLDRGALVSGRLYAKIGWAKGHDNALYRRWFDGIVRWVKKTTKRAPPSVGRWFIAPAAERFWREGNLFCFGDANALRAGPDLVARARPSLRRTAR